MQDFDPKPVFDVAIANETFRIKKGEPPSVTQEAPVPEANGAPQDCPLASLDGSVQGRDGALRYWIGLSDESGTFVVGDVFCS